METNELEALNLLHYSLVHENGGVLGPPFPVVHNHLICLDDVEGYVVILAPPGQVSDLQAYHCCVICKLNYDVGVRQVTLVFLGTETRVFCLKLVSISYSVWDRLKMSVKTLASAC